MTEDPNTPPEPDKAPSREEMRGYLPWWMQDNVLPWLFVIVVTVAVGVGLLWLVHTFAPDMSVLELAAWAGTGVFVAFLLSRILKSQTKDSE